MRNHRNDNVFKIDILTYILEFLSLKEILVSRICRVWRDAAKQTLLCHGELEIRDFYSAQALNWISDALPQIQKVKFHQVVRKDLRPYVAMGDDPIRKMSAQNGVQSQSSIVDISAIENFRHLRHLTMRVDLNGNLEFLIFSKEQRISDGI